MNASNLADRVADRTGLSRKAARSYLNATLGELARALQSEGKVTLSGFGTFEVRARRARGVRDPRTGATVLIPSYQTVTFRAGKGLRSTLGADSAGEEP